MKKSVLILLSLAVVLPWAKEVSKIKTTTAVQMAGHKDYAGDGHLSTNFIRSEITVSNKKKDGSAATLRIRMQTNMSEKVTFKLRRGWWKIPLGKSVTLQAGRWYESYFSASYFGRYTYGAKAKGTGSMLTNYTVVDGLKFVANVEAANSIFYFSFLPTTASVETLRLVPRVRFLPLEKLSLDLAGNFEMGFSKEESTNFALDFSGKKKHNASLSAEYKMGEKMGIRSQFGLVDFSGKLENGNKKVFNDIFWLTGGVQVPTNGFLDALWFDGELKANRGAGVPELGWLIVLKKKALGLSFDLNVGIAPEGLKSENNTDLGTVLRVTRVF